VVADELDHPVDWAAGADTSAEGSITVAESTRAFIRPSSRWPGIGDPGASTLIGAHTGCALTVNSGWSSRLNNW
jgi:hypothetical protein